MTKSTNITEEAHLFLIHYYIEIRKRIFPFMLTESVLISQSLPSPPDVFRQHGSRIYNNFQIIIIQLQR